ncbi:hypothetical protein WG915_02245 [Corynebacterium sp. H128]|uniref:hypothetical protein n=1 Tax=Corynebacterium sp. H128 TaxID=3133427 RepID=UPI0030B60786
MTAARVRKVLALLCTLLIIGAVIMASFDDRTSKPMLKNGDVLGQDTGESYSQYQQRADHSLVGASGTSWAMITFAEPLPAEHAGALVEQLHLKRVSGVVFADEKPQALPEPVAPETRIEVFERWTPPAKNIVGVIAYDDAELFRGLADNPQLGAIEVLPQGAAWGRFGVRPVAVD